MRPNIDHFIQTLRRTGTGYIPVAELGIHPTVKERFLGRPIRSLRDEADFWLQAGYDYVKLQPGADFNPGRAGAETRVTYNPDGTVFRKWASEGKGIITSDEDLDRYTFPEPDDFDYERFREIRGFLPPGMGVIGQYGDIFTMTWEMMGFETFSIALYENPSLVERLNTRVGTLVLGMFEYLARSSDVEVLWYSDDIAYSDSLMVSPGALRKYFFPWLKKIGELAARSGKPLIYHSDGVLYGVMDEIIESGVTALHPIEPKAMEIGEVKSRYGNRLSLIGGVDVDLLARGTPDEVRRRVRDCIRLAGWDGGYCVGSGNSIPEYVKFENYTAMLDAARRFGGP
jgi:uroporphyrinogen decarboxylase